MPTLRINPAGFAVPLTPGELSDLTDAIYVGVSGHALLTLENGDQVLFRNLESGRIYPIRVRGYEEPVDGPMAGGIVGLQSDARRGLQTGP